MILRTLSALSLAALLPLFLSVVGVEAASTGSGRGASTPFSAKPPAYQQYPARTTVPTAPRPPQTTAPAEKRGKYANPYDRSVPLQGETHQEYKGTPRDPYKRGN